jgi:dTDP-4-amino-4,6-dideoxygalactose transaminase
VFVREEELTHFTVMAMKEIPVALPWLGEEEAKAVRETVLSGWVTQGPKVKEFEDAFAASVSAHYSCAVSSCTAALNLALLAVGVKQGDVVVTVSHSFIATANAVRHCHAEPVFVDIAPDTLNMDPALLTRCLEDDFREVGDSLWYRDASRLAVGESPLCGLAKPYGRLAAILVVHQVGMPADLQNILPVARRYSIPVVEDAACAIGSEISLDGGITWESIGRPHGDVSCFSFHPRKVITTGDGGMLTTNDAKYDRLFRLLRQHGMNLSDVTRHHSEEVIFEDYITTGYNFRMTDIQAAVGIEQLKRLPRIVERRRRLASVYHERLAGIKGLHIPSEPDYAKTNWQSYVVRLDDCFSQKEVMQGLKNAGINTRRGIMCAHLELPYSKAWLKGSLPNSEAAQQQYIILPLYPSMNESEQGKVIDTLRVQLADGNA